LKTGINFDGGVDLIIYRDHRMHTYGEQTLLNTKLRSLKRGSRINDEQEKRRFNSALN